MNELFQFKENLYCFWTVKKFKKKQYENLKHGTETVIHEGSNV